MNIGHLSMQKQAHNVHTSNMTTMAHNKDLLLEFGHTLKLRELVQSTMAIYRTNTMVIFSTVTNDDPFIHVVLARTIKFC